MKQPIVVVKPVLIPVAQPIKEEQPNNSGIIRQESPKTIRNNSPTIPKNSDSGIDSELFEPTRPAPQAAIPAYKKKGKVVGRQRKYEELGNRGERPIRELILFRQHTGKHWPGLSDDMQKWYEKYYFTRPKKGSKDYEQHKAAYERGRRWIADDAVTTPGALSPAVATRSNVVAYRKRSASS